MLRQRPRLAVLVALLVVSLLSFPLAWRAMHDAGHVAGATFADFGVYYRTVGDWRAGETIYDVDDPFGNYLYPPVYLIAVVPFYDLFDWTTAADLWAIASVGSLWLAVQALVWTYVPSLSAIERLLLAPVSLVLLVGFHPVWYGTRLGQASVVLGAVATFAAVAMERGRRGRRLDTAASGVLTAVAGTVKLFYAPIGAHLLLDRRRLTAAAVTGLGLLAGSLVVFGTDALVDYLHVLAWGEDWGESPAHPSWGWISGYYRPLYVLGDQVLPVVSIPLSLLVRVGVLGSVLGIALWVRHTDAHRPVFALGLVTIPLAGPQVSTHDFAVLIPALIMLAAIEADRDGRVWLVVLAALGFQWQAYGTFALATLPATLPGADTIVAASPLLQPGLYANVAVIGLAAYRALQHRPPHPRITPRE